MIRGEKIKNRRTSGRSIVASLAFHFAFFSTFYFFRRIVAMFIYFLINERRLFHRKTAVFSQDMDSICTR